MATALELTLSWNIECGGKSIEAVAAEAMNIASCSAEGSAQKRERLIRERQNARLKLRDNFLQQVRRKDRIASVIPRMGVGDKFLLTLHKHSESGAFLCANLGSFALDYCARQKVGSTSLKYFTVRQLPVLPPTAENDPSNWESTTPINNWISQRVLELIYNARDLDSFGRDFAWDGNPFLWDPEGRFLLCCELDGAFFHLYMPSDKNGDWLATEREAGKDLPQLRASFPKPRDAVVYIMETFPIVRRNDEAAYGEYRTKRVILEIYDRMQRAIAIGVPYESVLDPPPADPRVAHHRED